MHGEKTGVNQIQPDDFHLDFGFSTAVDNRVGNSLATKQLNRLRMNTFSLLGPGSFDRRRKVVR
jgi:hypothetical protein